MMSSGHPPGNATPTHVPPRQIALGKAGLERFKKYCSHWSEKNEVVILLGFGVVFRSVTGRCGHAPSLSLAKTPKTLAANGHTIF